MKTQVKGHKRSGKVVKSHSRVTGKKPKLGTGKRFAALEENIEHENEGKKKSKKVKDPAALAAAIGRKKYGAKRFGELAAKGK